MLARGVSSSSSPSSSSHGMRRRTARGWRCLPVGFGGGVAGLVGEREGSSPGRYVFPGQPRAGSLHLFGVTTIGERSYIDGESAMNVRVMGLADGKRTSGWRTEGSIPRSCAGSSRGDLGAASVGGGELCFLRIGRGHGQ